MAAKKKKVSVGRPAGRKNNATLMKESELAKAIKMCEGTATLEAPAIVMAMARKAKDGDVSAAKLILDRVYPAMRQSEDSHKGAVNIQINIVEEQSDGNDTHNGKEISSEPGTTFGQESTETASVQVFSEYADEDGERSH